MMARTSRKGRLLYLACALALGAVFMSSGSYASDSSQKSLSFANRDLQPYDDSPNHKLQEQDSPAPKGSGPRKAKTADSREQAQKEYWCKKASQQRRKVQRLNDDVSEKEQQLEEENRKGVVGHKKTAALNKEFTKTRKRLKYAQDDLSAVEDEAHRKGVPPGWLSVSLNRMRNV